MSRTTANVSFYCRESKKNRHGLAPIELSLIINKRRCYIQLPRKEHPDQFKAQVTGKKRTDLTDYLEGIRARLNQIATTFLMDGKALTADALKSYWKFRCKVTPLFRSQTDPLFRFKVTPWS